MKSLVHKFLLLGVALLIALPIAAQEKKKKDKGGAPNQIAQIKKGLANVDLKDDQKKKIDDIFAEYGPKLDEANKKAGDAPKKIADARKKLQDEGKKGKELNDAVKSAVTLTDDEKAAVEALDKLNGDLRAAVGAVLTDEQKDKAGLSKGKKKKDK